jgi:hypothetical protein
MRYRPDKTTLAEDEQGRPTRGRKKNNGALLGDENKCKSDETSRDDCYIANVPSRWLVLTKSKTGDTHDVPHCPLPLTAVVGAVL